MARFIGFFRVYLIVIRILYFLLLFLFLIMSGVEKPVFLSVFLPSMALNLLFVSHFFARLPMKWKTAALWADLLLLSVLIPGIGQYSSPLFLYSFTTLLLFSTYLRVKTVILVGIFFYLTLYFLLRMVEDRFPVSHEFFVTFTFYGQFFLIISLIFFFDMLLDHLRVLFLQLVRIRLFFKRLHESDTTTDMIRQVEKTMRMIMKLPEIDYVWLYDSSWEADWKQQWYARQFRDERLTRIRRPSKEILHDYDGTDKKFLVIPFRHGGILYAALLIPNEEEVELDWFILQLFRLVSDALLAHIQKLKRDEHKALRMRDEVMQDFAQRLHDGLAQKIFFLSAQAYHLRNQSVKVLPKEEQILLQRMEEEIKEIHREIRKWLGDLQGEGESPSFFGAVKQLVDRLTRGSTMEVKIITKGEIWEEEVDYKEAIYLMVEELISNVLKHAKATRLAVTIEVTPLQWFLHVRDDGIGFNEQESLSRGKYGIEGMRRRVKGMGGTMVLKTEEGEGTDITVILPRKGMKGFAI